MKSKRKINNNENRHPPMPSFHFILILLVLMFPYSSAMTTSRTSASMFHGYKSKLSINNRHRPSPSWKSIAVSTDLHTNLSISTLTK